MTSTATVAPIEHVIETELLTKRYGDVIAVDQLSLRVPRGGVFGFLGPNGSGKTTTMGMLLGLVHPTSGEARIFGDPARHASTLRRVGAMVESPTFYPYLTGRANLTVSAPGGGQLMVGTLASGDYLGQTALTREKVTAGVSAVDELTVLRVPVAAVDALVHSKPELARDIGRAIDLRRQRVVDAVRSGVAAELSVGPAARGRTVRGAYRGAR